MKRSYYVWIVVAALLFVGLAGWRYIWVYASKDTIPGGVVLQGRSGMEDGSVSLGSSTIFAIGGLTIDAALEQIQHRTDALRNLKFTLQANGKKQNKTWTLSQLGVHIDTKDAAAVISKLTAGNMWDRLQYRRQFPANIHFELRWNKEQFKKQVRSVWGMLDANEPVNATRTITSDERIVYTPHQNAYRLDMNRLLIEAQTALENAAAEQWGAAGEAADIVLPLPLRTVQPNVTLERLKSEGIERKIASFTTDFSSSGKGRTYNVSMVAKTLNDWQLAPDEVFDYRKVISLTRDKYGFREAPVILNGELVPGIGGGICQVSSTLYNAALLAGLEMVERRNHSLPVSYLPKGRDATFAEGAINFRFKNTTGKHVIIRTSTSGRKLTVMLFGTLPHNIKYKIQSATVKVIEPPVKEIPSSIVPAGERLLMKTGKPGYIIETYRIALQDGKEVSRTRISRDTYKAQPTVYSISPEHSGPRAIKSEDGPGSRKQLLEDGVRSED
ncbi:VanW family protein [Paenibacillus oenotherae]|uniref:VanW family protein n=1 Tax=Paenibacillus oenotherae TaxID=1435645 RepID=A0ABS7D4X9_9BACL|nr:VanW family protein [Paenibacillus oenotherae]MBW7474963.1 VanW family protein [Paenibacillus oenotherae]